MCDLNKCEHPYIDFNIDGTFEYIQGSIIISDRSFVVETCRDCDYASEDYMVVGGIFGTEFATTFKYNDGGYLLKKYFNVYKNNYNVT